MATTTSEFFKTQSPPYTDPPRVGHTVFMTTIWAVTAVSFSFLGVRIFSRIRSIKRLHGDDYLVIFAWGLSLLSATCWHFISPKMYEVQAIGSGDIWPPPDNVITRTKQYFSGQLIVIAFFHAILYFIKMSFMIFFKKLGKDIPTLTVYWYGVFAFTGAAFLVTLGTMDYQCMISAFEDILAKCLSPDGKARILFALRLATALDVTTDCLVMTIPFSILWRVRIPLKRRLALFGIFSLVLITIAFSITRLAVISHNLADPSWLYMWSSIEQNIAILVACLGSFKTLFSAEGTSLDQPQFSLREATREVISSSRSRFRSRGSGNSRGRGRSGNGVGTDGDNWSASDLPYLSPWNGTAEATSDQERASESASSELRVLKRTVVRMRDR
ncbi:uncharacterized protein BDR25DRAFT_346681 [Lindgomyces ingoldianus]|uniref:Uncharacterized protein n=1 Tax=Lindgomyces ingoldianus TaxID=673940 RepID=A0ACB6QC24_9PLEO|nr:uncharacterized protein BDR25DRAFT_346681 [Lindgomyces ingoldianus]KAF2464461.1 hypothetical protein BDR25DRAFT_346681 [Lindgomyces ingoldianus]